MKRSKQKSIQTFLTSYLIAFSLILLALMTVVMCRMQYASSRDETIQTLLRTAVSAADSVDQHLNQMNQVSLNAISSRDLKDAFEQYFSEGLSAYERNRQNLHLANALTTAKGFDFSIRQLNVFTLDGEGFGVGEEFDNLRQKAQEQVWYEKAKEARGLPVVSVSDGYISLSRLFFNDINVPMGFAEVRKYLDTVFYLAEAPGISYPVSIHIYSKEGNRLFPYGEEEDSFSYYDLVQDSESDPSRDSEEVLQTTAAGKNEIVCVARSDKMELLVTVAAERSVYLRQVYSFLFRILPIILVMLAIILVLSLILSRRLSSPIRHIYHFLSEENKDRFSLLEMDYTNIREIDKLHDSINESITSIKTSTDTLMILKEQEVQAQMLSLQSQMNPHFLYNSLSTIGEMAQEGMTEPVARMCDMITDIMRYISSNREQRSSLEEELEVCDMYMECLKMRYQDHLTWKISVDDEILESRVPKLCIQLLVENAVRSVTTLAPPWHVDITCTQNEENWYVTVSDNGPGFDPEVDQRLRAQMRQILDEGILPSLKIQGMGLLNIFIRLYLLDGIPFIFDFGNRPEGGAFVTIGGSLHQVKEPIIVPGCAEGGITKMASGNN